MIYDLYEIIVVPFPFTDKDSAKRRPAVVLSNKDFHHSTDHVVVAMITSAKNSNWLSDLPIGNVKLAGLTTACVIRMKIFTLARNLIVKKIGKLSPTDAKRLLENVDSIL